MTLALQQIRPVHPGSSHPDQDFSVAGSRDLAFPHLQHFRSAKTGEFDCSHASSIASDMCGNTGLRSP